VTLIRLNILAGGLMLVLALTSTCPSWAKSPSWAYAVRVGPAARVLDVEARFSPDCPREISVSTGAEPYVENVRLATPKGWVALPTRRGSWFLPRLRSAAHVRYRFRLMEAAGHAQGAERHGEVVDAVPGVYLLHSLRQRSGSAYVLRVRAAPGVAFVSGLHPRSDGGFESDVSDVGMGAHTAFGPLRETSVECGDARLVVAFANGLPLARTPLRSWIAAKARAVARFYGRFPVRRVLILLTPDKIRGIHGRADGGGGASISLVVGPGVDSSTLKSDWTITHEMVHLAFPGVRAAHHWIEEGLATYVEPILRARSGDLPVSRVWRDMARDLPQGQPGPGDRGLDRTHTWARTYWGGALFCFVADMRIRAATEGRRSLRDALRGIQRAGGDITRMWPLEKTLRVGDRATGTRVLESMYATWKDTPVRVDLAAWWHKLGVARDGETVVLNDRAPLAATRQAVTEDLQAVGP
jgi:hypothetical protein